MLPRTMTRVLALAAVAAACTQQHVNPEPVTVLRNGERVPDASAAVAQARDRVAADQASAAYSRDSIMAAAMTGCAPDVCAAVTRGEVTLGMNETQLMAATRTTPAAWSIRRAADAAIYTSARMEQTPRDMVAPVALVQIQRGEVASIAYAEPNGVRTIAKASDATADARAKATADALVREGDAAVAAGQLDVALAHYDRASVLAPKDASIEYKIATLLDKQLRPIEAIVRYQRFLHQMELERIQAVGDAYAKQAEAIAHAKERIIVLEKH
ncbi:MAG TPA: hypothetical protein VHM30_13030 [Gemmatimonadaceae bacterium]|nr:hypothetical protein [Gemmatimonadaceae bacterium]